MGTINGMLVCVLIGTDLSEFMVSSCSGVPCCVIVGWFNGNKLMVDLVAHYKGLFPSSLLEGFPLKISVCSSTMSNF